MGSKESQDHYNSKSTVKKWILEWQKIEGVNLDILPVYEFPVTKDNSSFTVKDGHEELLYTPEVWLPSKREDVFNDYFNEIDYIFDWSGVDWWQKDLPPTYEQLEKRSTQVYVIFDIGLISKGDFCVNVPFLNPRCKDEFTETDLAPALLGAIEIEHTHRHSSNKKKFIEKLPFEILDLTTYEILFSPAECKSKISFYLEELSVNYRWQNFVST